MSRCARELKVLDEPDRKEALEALVKLLLTPQDVNNDEDETSTRDTSEVQTKDNEAQEEAKTKKTYLCENCHLTQDMKHKSEWFKCKKYICRHCN